MNWRYLQGLFLLEASGESPLSFCSFERLPSLLSLWPFPHTTALLLMSSHFLPLALVSLPIVKGPLGHTGSTQRTQDNLPVLRYLITSAKSPMIQLYTHRYWKLGCAEPWRTLFSFTQLCTCAGLFMGNSFWKSFKIREFWNVHSVLIFKHF